MTSSCLQTRSLPCKAPAAMLQAFKADSVVNVWLRRLALTLCSQASFGFVALQVKQHPGTGTTALFDCSANEVLPDCAA